MSWPDGERYSRPLFSDWRHTVSSKFFDTQVFSISTEELELPHYAHCVLSRLCCNGYSLLLSFYFSNVGRIENSSCGACGHLSFSTCTVQLRTLRADRFLATLCLFTTYGPRLGELPGFWDSMVFRHALIPRKSLGNSNRPSAICLIQKGSGDNCREARKHFSS